jgi:hypothetical protein
MAPIRSPAALKTQNGNSMNDQPGAPRPEDQSDAPASGPPDDAAAAARPQPDTAPAGMATGRKPTGRNARPLVLGGVIVGLAVVGILLITLLVGRTPATLRWAPDHATIIASIKLSELIESDAYANAKRQLPELAEGIEHMREELAIAPDQVRRITVAGDPENNMPLVIVECTEELDQDRIKEELLHGDVETKQSGEHEIASSRFRAVTFADSRTLVHGDERELSAVARRDGRPQLGDAMREAIDEADLDHLAMFAVSIADLDKSRMPDPMRAFAGKLRYACGSLSVGGTVRAEVLLKCAESETAGRIKEMAEGLVAAMSLALDVATEHKLSVEAIGELIDSIRIERSGSTVSARAAIDADDVGDLLAEIKALAKARMLPNF